MVHRGGPRLKFCIAVILTFVSPAFATDVAEWMLKEDLKPAFGVFKQWRKERWDLVNHLIAADPNTSALLANIIRIAEYKDEPDLIAALVRADYRAISALVSVFVHAGRRCDVDAAVHLKPFVEAVGLENLARTEILKDMVRPFDSAGAYRECAPRGSSGLVYVGSEDACDMIKRLLNISAREEGLVRQITGAPSLNNRLWLETAEALRRDLPPSPVARLRKESRVE